MKNISLFAATAAFALLQLIACQKEQIVSNNSAGNVEEIRQSPVFTAAIGNPGTKTAISASGISQYRYIYKVNWEPSDSILVKDAAGGSATYKVSRIDETTGLAEFTIKEGETALGEGPYSATYGTEPPATQTWKEIIIEEELPAFPAQLYMKSDTLETGDHIFTFDVKCGVILFQVAAPGVNLSSISVTCTPTGSATEKVYTLVCEEPQDISEGLIGALAVPACTFNKITFTDDKGLVSMRYNYKGEYNDDPNEVQVNQVLIRTFPYIPFYLLPSEFSIAEDARVMFAAGNDYYYDDIEGRYGHTWEENQYDVASTSGFDANHTGLLYWHSDYAGTAEEEYGTLYGEGGDHFFAADPAKFSTSISYMAKGAGDMLNDCKRNFALSKEQWEYLLNLNEGITGRSQTNRFAKARVNDVNGLLVFPDNYDNVPSDAGIAAINATRAPFPGTSVTTDHWASLLADGVMFLPVAGKRWYEDEQVKFDANAAHYWTSSLEDETQTGDDANAYYLDFGDNDIKFVAGSRKEGRAVRLAKPANLFFTPTD